MTLETTSTGTLWLELSKRIPAAPGAVFDAWLSPTAMARFMCPAPNVEVKNVEVDARSGGAFSLDMVAGETVIPVRGHYVDVERPGKLSFTWLSAHTTDDSVVTLTFEPDPAGTFLTLRHEGFPDEGARENHSGGWRHILDRLAAHCDATREGDAQATPPRT